jgi:predicted N-acetyltransferase YhbS
VRDSIRIRTATEQDARAIGRILEASYPALLPRHYDADLISEAMPILTRPDVRLLNSGRYYVAEDGERTVGCGGWSLDAPPGAEEIDNAAVIRRFAVLPELARMGIGRSLFEHCLAKIRGLSVRRMIVRSSLNAEPFYAALGFRPLHAIAMPLPSGRGLPCILMDREL